MRYLEGTWALPSDPITEPSPSGLVQVMELRVSRLTALARGLAALMSVRRGGVTLPLAAAALHAPADQILDALDELVGDGIVEVEGEQYVFAQQAMRELIARGLTQERSAELHTALAHALLVSADSSANVQLEAGWHLLHTKDELRGAEQLARIAPGLLRGGLHIAEAIAALARAHDVFERHGRPLAVRLRLRTELVSAGYYFDYRLGLQYGERTLLELFRSSGLALKQRLVHFVPRPVAAALSFSITAIRRYFLPEAERGPHPIVAMMLFGRAGMALMGYHFQREELARVAELGEDFLAKHPPRTVIGWGPAYAMIIDAMASLGRAERAVEIAQRALSTLSQSDFEYFVMYALLQAALAWALACVGDFETAMQQISVLAARFSYANEHSWLALMHSQRARIAARAGNREALRASIRDLRLAALSSNNAPLVVLARRWELRYDRALLSPPPLAAGSAQRPTQPLNDGPTLTTDYLRAGSKGDRYERALDVLTRACGGTESYLYVLRSTGIRRVASLSDVTPPDALSEQVAMLLHTQPLPSICRLELPANSNDTNPDAGQSYRILLLPATSAEHKEAVAVLEGAQALVEPETEMLFEVSAALG